jgi:hypothetical protein
MTTIKRTAYPRFLKVLATKDLLEAGAISWPLLLRRDEGLENGWKLRL